jgi:hypothetical protein
VKATALSDLPMDPSRLLVVTLNAVHSEIWFAGRWTLSVNQWERDKVSAVFVPELEQRKLFEIDFRLP